MMAPNIRGYQDETLILGMGILGRRDLFTAWRNYGRRGSGTFLFVVLVVGNEGVERKMEATTFLMIV